MNTLAMKKNEKWVKVRNLSIFYTLVLGMFQFGDLLYGSTFMLKLNSENFSVTTIGFLSAYAEFINLIFDYPSGIISDKFGRKMITGISLIILGTSFFLFAIASNIFMYIVSYTALGIGIALYSGSLSSWYYTSLVDNDGLEWRDDLMSKIAIFTKLFAFVSPLIASTLIIFSLKTPLYIGSVIVIMAGIICLIFFEDNKGNIANENMFVLMKNYSYNFFRDVRMRKIFFIELFQHVGYLILILTWQLNLLNTHNLSESFVAIMLSALMLSMALGSFTTNLLLKKFSPLKCTYIAKWIIAFSSISLFLSHNLYLTLFSLILFDFALSISLVSSSIWKNEYISNDNRSTYVSILSSLKSVFTIFISISIGFLVDVFGYNLIWIFALIFGLLSIYVLSSFIKYDSDNKEV